MSFEFGEHLKDLRFDKGLTQAEVAKLLYIDRSTYTKYELGISEPDLKTLQKLCRIFDVDYNTIMNYKQN